MTSPFLSERQVAARWQVGRSTVGRLRASGRLPFMQIGSVIRYRMSDIERFESEQLHDAFVLGITRPPPIRRNV